MMLRIGVEQPPNHAGFILKEINASLAQRDGNFHSFISKDEFLRPRKEVRNDLEVSKGSSVYLIFSLINSRAFPPVTVRKFE